VFTHWVSFIFDGVQVTCLVKSVFFKRCGWRKWAEICHKILFQSQYICDRNTSIGARGLWEWGSELIKSFYVVFSILRWKESGRRQQERWLYKIVSNWGKLCCCCWFGQKWPSNHIKNDSRIFEHPQDCSSSDSERELGNWKLSAHFVSHSLTPEQREDWVTSCQDIIPTADTDKNFSFSILLQEMRPGVLPMTLKQSGRVLSGLVKHPQGWRNWNSKGPTQDHVDNFFRLSRRNAQRIRTREKNSKCRIL
jgi:hypothetical protein